MEELNNELVKWIQFRATLDMWGVIIGGGAAIVAAVVAIILIIRKNREDKKFHEQ